MDKKLNIEELKTIVAETIEYQNDLQDLLYYFSKHLNRPEYLKAKIIVVNDLYTDIRDNLIKIIEICINLFY